MSTRAESFPVLDHGYVKYIEHWGCDERIIESARMSTGKGFLGWGPWPCETCHGTGEELARTVEGWLGNGQGEAHAYTQKCTTCKGSGKVEGDERLLRYLYTHHHDTPFEFAGLIIEVQAPIMVFREWHRHRTQSYNEMSARYTPLPDLNYRPTTERCLMVSNTNKQAGAASDNELTHDQVLDWLSLLDGLYHQAQEVYQLGLEMGLPKEIARLPVPVGRYSRMRASACLRNWLAFLTLRSDIVPSGRFAQWEIRQFANPVGSIIQNCFPRTYELFACGK